MSLSIILAAKRAQLLPSADNSSPKGNANQPLSATANSSKSPLTTTLSATATATATQNINNINNIDNINNRTIAAFLLYLREPTYIPLAEALEAFDIPYTPWTCKAATEFPSKEFLLAVIHFYMARTSPAINSISQTETVCRGIGRILSDSQQLEVISILERSTNGTYH